MACYEFEKKIQLGGCSSPQDNAAKRVSEKDASRQKKTAEAILEQLENQPGLILADEVGMGKTFVALAVAVSVNLADARRRPVVVMVPSSLAAKWTRDFSFFVDKCLPGGIKGKFRCRTATNGTQFLKLLDDPLERRASVIFLNHGALHRALTDGWVKLAIIQHSLRYKRDKEKIVRILSRCCGDLLQMNWVEKGNKHADIWEELLQTHPDQWLTRLQERRIDPENDRSGSTDDDPVPKAVIKALHDFDTTAVYQALKKLPERRRTDDGWNGRVSDVRIELKSAMDGIWTQCLHSDVNATLPLLILDEAHHLKNEATRLAGLFRSEDSEKDAVAVSQGALAGVFERMLFLTATPFRLGHHELCSVLRRFGGIDWHSRNAPSGGSEGFTASINELEQKLDAAKQATSRLEAAWGQLKPDDLRINGSVTDNVEQWWQHVASADSPADHLPIALEILKKTTEADKYMRNAEELLKPFVIRHLRDRTFNGHLRRERKPGDAILTDQADNKDRGIPVTGSSLLPFLLAARATTCQPDKRPLFAEGLASSWSAFRKNQVDEDEDANDEMEKPAVGAVAWYLRQLDRSLPVNDADGGGTHPKVDATVDRAIAAWMSGEKVLVFCHFIATGRLLRRAISQKMKQRIREIAASRAGCGLEDAESMLQRYGDRLSASPEPSPARRAFDDRITRLLMDFPALMELNKDTTSDHSPAQICRRFARTPSFLVRYFPLQSESLNEHEVNQAFETADSIISAVSLRDSGRKTISSRHGPRAMVQCCDGREFSD